MLIQESPVWKVIKAAPSAGSKRRHQNNWSLTTYERDYSLGSLRDEDDNQNEEYVAPIYKSPPREIV